MEKKFNIEDFKMDAFKNENPFEVPANYFDSLPLAIQNKTSNLTKEESIFDKMMFIFSPKFGIAFTAFLIVVLLAIKLNEPKETNYFAGIEIDAPVLMNSLNLPEDEILLAELYITKKEIQLDDKVIINYLLDENIEIYELY